MASFANLVAQATKHHEANGANGQDPDSSLRQSSAPNSRAPSTSAQRSPRPSSTIEGRLSVNRNSILKMSSPMPGTPSARTGPPGTLSFSYNAPSRRQSRFEGEEESVEPSWKASSLGKRPALRQVDTEFRSALEYQNPEQREQEQELKEKRERRRHNRNFGNEDLRNPMKWWSESPREEKQPWDWHKKEKENHVSPTIVEEDPSTPSPATPGPSQPSRRETADDERTALAASRLHSRRPSSASRPASAFRTPHPPPPPRLYHLARSSSLPDIQQTQLHQDESLASPKVPSTPRWTRLKSYLPTIASQNRQKPAQSSVVTPHTVNITDELISGGLSTLMLQMWFERDEKDHRRVPILFHRLRIRISDSLYPLSGNKAVFRIECEYANGAARWVVYRQLRDFLSLHTHYTVSNVYNRSEENIPEFPRTSLRSMQLLLFRKY